MRALVTGAAGFIGSHLAEDLIRKGYDVTCLVRKTSNLRWIENLHVRLLFHDLSEIDSCEESLDGFEVVFHVAGLTRAATEKDFFSANAGNTGRLLKTIFERNRSLKRFLYLSSLAAAGPASGETPVREDSLPMPVSSYGRSKLAGEKEVMKYRDRLPVTIVRPPAVYGPRDGDFFQLFRMIKKGFYPYWGRCVYSLLYVDDLVRGITAASESERAAGELFFLTDARTYTNEEVTREISDVLGVHPIRLPLPRQSLSLLAYFSQKFSKDSVLNSDRVNDFRHPLWICDAGKAKEALDFQPRISLKQGMQWTADWYRIHQWL